MKTGKQRYGRGERQNLWLHILSSVDLHGMRKQSLHEALASARNHCDTDTVVCSRSPLGKKLQIHNSLSLSSSKESLYRRIKLVEDYLGYHLPDTQHSA